MFLVIQYGTSTVSRDSRTVHYLLNSLECFSFIVKQKQTNNCSPIYIILQKFHCWLFHYSEYEEAFVREPMLVANIYFLILYFITTEVAVQVKNTDRLTSFSTKAADLTSVMIRSSFVRLTRGHKSVMPKFGSIMSSLTEFILISVYNHGNSIGNLSGSVSALQSIE